MFNKQLKVNIVELDVQIRRLSSELEDLKKDSKYEIKMEKLEALVELKCKLAKTVKEGETTDAIIELDKQIEELAKAMINLEKDEAYASKIKQLEDLTNVRTQLAECKVKESHAKEIISGILGVSAMMLVLNYEKTDIVTSKAFGIASKLFRGV